MFRYLLRLNFWIFTILFASLTQVFALSFPIPVDHNDTIGVIQTVKVEKGDDFYGLARRYDVGFDELVQANPGMDPERPLLNAMVIIPTKYVLPNVPHQGIVINLAEMRLYYFPPDQALVYTYPVGVGQLNWATPEGDLHIIEKIKDPVWVVPDSIMRYRQQRGDPVPKVVEAGPDNPLGQFAMRLSNPTYLIHGTNEPTGVGQRSSAGCMRLYPEDIEALFNGVPKGTPVKIINEPYKLGYWRDQLVMEAHLPLQEDKERYAAKDYFSNWVDAFFTARGQSVSPVNQTLVNKAVEDHTGLPTVIGSEENGG